MTTRAPRRLRPEEKELWDKVRHSTVPLHVAKKQALSDAIKKISPTPSRPFIGNFHIGQKLTSAVSAKSIVTTPPIRMDSKNFAKMKRGKLVPQSRIDLHGMTVAQAHPALIRFVLNAHFNGERLVLVITGKGKAQDMGGPVPVRKGVLKHQVPQWLSQAPLNGIIQQVADAHFRHGGGGALYVYLHRRR